jgi:hypothetical protein
MAQESGRIAITCDDGSLSVMQFMVTGRSPTLPLGAAWINQGTENWRREPTDAAIGAEIAKAFQASAVSPVSWRIVGWQGVPADRSFRDAWVDTNGTITHDMAKARSIHLARLRAKRDQDLADLDGPWMKAVGQKDKTEEERIEAERQALRDLPQRVQPLLDAAQTVGELKLVR